MKKQMRIFSRCILPPSAIYVVFALAVNCRANLVIIGPQSSEHNPIAHGSDGDFVVLAPDPVIYQPAGGSSAQLLKLMLDGEFGGSRGWSFTIGSALNGTLNIDHYYAQMFLEHTGGAELFARYNGTPSDNFSDLEKLRWIQLIDTNDPIGPFNPSLDPPPGDINFDDRPFYYTEADQTANSFGTNKFGDYDLFFHDRPRRTAEDHPDFFRFRATLFLVTSDLDGGRGNVTIHDGITWGFDFVAAPPVPELGSWITTGIWFGSILALFVWRRVLDGRLDVKQGDSL